MKKKGLLIVLCMIFILTGCAGSDDLETAEPVVTITLAKSKDLPGLEKVMDRFEADHPNIRIKVADMPNAQEDRHRIYVSALSGRDSSVDLYWVEDTWIDEFAANDYLLPLDQYLKLDKGKYLPQALEMFTRSERLMALPVALDMGFLYYRRDLVQEIPTSWDGILELSKSVMRQEKIAYGVDISNEVSENMIYNILEFQDAQGGSLPAALKSYKNILDFNDQQKDAKNKFFSTFKSGDALFLRDGSLAWTRLGDDLSAVRGKVGITMLPKAGGAKTSALLGGYGLGINRNAKHIPQAAELLAYLSETDVQRAMAQEYGYMPVQAGLYENEMVLDINPHFRGLLEIIPTLRQRNQAGGYADHPEQTQRVLQKFFQNKISADQTAEQLGS